MPVKDVIYIIVCYVVVGSLMAGSSSEGSSGGVPRNEVLTEAARTIEANLTRSSPSDGTPERYRDDVQRLRQMRRLDRITPRPGLRSFLDVSAHDDIPTPKATTDSCTAQCRRAHQVLPCLIQFAELTNFRHAHIHI